jgi:hypothetical protein
MYWRNIIILYHCTLYWACIGVVCCSIPFICSVSARLWNIQYNCQFYPKKKLGHSIIIKQIFIKFFRTIWEIGGQNFRKNPSFLMLRKMLRKCIKTIHDQFLWSTIKRKLRTKIRTFIREYRRFLKLYVKKIQSCIPHKRQI